MRISDWSSDVCSSDLKIERDTGITGAMARQRYEELVPLGRLGEALDVAYGVLYFASDESRHVTGAQLVIDGGSTLGKPAVQASQGGRPVACRQMGRASWRERGCQDV